MKEDKMEKLKNEHVSVDVIILVALVIILIALVSFYLIGGKEKGTTSRPTISPTQRQEEVLTQTPLATGTVVITRTPTIEITKAPTATPTPSPKPIPHGSKNFMVSIGSDIKGPRMGKGTIDPYDPAIGGKQKLTIEVNDTVPVQKVVATLKTDKKTTEHTLTAGPGVTNKGNWSGEWAVDDSYLHTYILSIQATSASGTSIVDVTLR